MKAKLGSIVGFLFISFFVFADDNSASLNKRADDIYNSNPDSSFKLGVLAEQLAVKEDNKEQQGFALLKQARYHILKSNLETAAEKLELALSVFLEINSKKGLANTYSLNSFLSGRLKKEEEEINYLEKSLSIYQEIADTNGMRNTLTNLSLQYIFTENYDIAKKHLLHLNKLLEGQDNKEVYYLKQNWGLYYSGQGDYHKALSYYILAKEIADKNGMIDSRSTINLTIGGAYQKLGDYPRAEQYMNDGLRIGQQHNLVHETLEAYQGLQALYEDWKKTEMAYETFKKIVTIRDTLYNVEKVNRLNDYDKKLALAEKEKKIAEQKFEVEQKNRQAEVEKSKSRVLLIIVLLVVVISGIAIFAFIKTKKLKDEVALQKEEAENQRNYLEDAYKNITDSIEYAKRIQQAVLKGEEHQSAHLPEHFVLFEPKDIVSGDFYWAQEMGDDLYVAVADCTGHGVPGAFMSMLGIAFLNDIFSDYSGLTPAQILDELRKRIISEMGQTGKEGENRDGMDISLVRLNLKTRELEWAGANNPLWIVRNDKNVEEIKPDKQPIGFFSKMTPFNNHQLKLDQGDALYLFSDGYADQFGGLKGKKLKYKPFKELLIQNFEETMDMQKLLLKKYFVNWKGDYQQVDDVCVMGLRV